jgi:predicted nucleic acid-binding protein
MSLSAFPADPDAALIADASVVIGLNASGQARRVIELIERRVIVPDNAGNELAIGARFGHDDGAQLDALVAAGLVERLPLEREAVTTYTALIDSTYGETLDDGEAATIALAVQQGAVAVLDEKKARRMCRQHFPHVVQGCTAQWLLGVAALGGAAHAEAMVNALRKGRMRVPPEFLDAVVALIGLEAAATCPSLPRLARQAAAQSASL